MEAHDNREVAELFRKLARIEHRHAERILEEMSWTKPPAPPSTGYLWEGLEALRGLELERSAVTWALIDFANRTPSWTARAESSDPSVGSKIWWYMRRSYSGNCRCGHDSPAPERLLDLSQAVGCSDERSSTRRSLGALT